MPPWPRPWTGAPASATTSWIVSSLERRAFLEQVGLVRENNKTRLPGQSSWASPHPGLGGLGSPQSRTWEHPAHEDEGLATTLAI